MAAESIDISGDGGILKKIIREGTEGANTPLKGAQVKVHYVGTLENGSKFDSSRDRGQFFEFKLGQGQVIKGWDQGVATMKRGELAILTCRSDYAYGDSGSPPTIPGKATLNFEVELFEWEDPDPDTTPEKLTLALKRKELGNNLYKEGKYEDAISKYQLALKMFEQMWSLTDEEKKKVNADVKLPCLLNIAQCQLKVNDFSEAISSSNKALDIDKENVKAIFRRGQANLRSGNFLQARSDFTEALKLSPDMKDIRAELELLKKKEAEYKDREKNLFAKMFAAPKPKETQQQ